MNQTDQNGRGAATEQGLSRADSCSAVETALLLAMRRNRVLMDGYKHWPKTVAALKEELVWGCEAFVENNEDGMVRVTKRMMDNLEPLPEWDDPQNAVPQAKPESKPQD